MNTLKTKFNSHFIAEVSQQTRFASRTLGINLGRDPALMQ